MKESSRVAEKKTRPETKKELINTSIREPTTGFVERIKKLRHAKDRTKDCVLTTNRRFLSWGLKNRE